MATRVTTIPVECYEVPAYNPRDPEASKPVLMRPTPMEKFEGRFGRESERRSVRAELVEKGHDVQSVNWGQRKGDGADCLFVYIRQPGTVAPSKPIPPPPQTRRSAVSRRHAPRPETRKKS
jgi:hypothetical protein